MSDQAKIPCTVITGFLGAGKTTLVRHLLENAGGRRIAVLVNEFGDLGFDGSFIEGCGIEGCTQEDIVELPNGCLCCTVADDFVPALNTPLHRASPPEHLLTGTRGPRRLRAAAPCPPQPAVARLHLARHPLPRDGRRRDRRGGRPRRCLRRL